MPPRASQHLKLLRRLRLDEYQVLVELHLRCGCQRIFCSQRTGCPTGPERTFTLPCANILFYRTDTAGPQDSASGNLLHFVLGSQAWQNDNWSERTITGRSLPMLIEAIGLRAKQRGRRKLTASDIRHRAAWQQRPGASD